MGLLESSLPLQQCCARPPSHGSCCSSHGLSSECFNLDVLVCEARDVPFIIGCEVRCGSSQRASQRIGSILAKRDRIGCKTGAPGIQGVLYNYDILWSPPTRLSLEIRLAEDRMLHLLLQGTADRGRTSIEATTEKDLEDVLPNLQFQTFADGGDALVVSEWLGLRTTPEMPVPENSSMGIQPEGVVLVQFCLNKKMWALCRAMKQQRVNGAVAAGSPWVPSERASSD
eukprot:gnl/MRDRNA2_/MRDRNA2_66940_c0_seq1.p1 gnl/MRDRNA2_/MRDRNA2_66940_c0~~gnl/MRDRNA2_/MRDRNA2_66940_c0_seq1.p1  ORF type:complete len:228 (+),score=23.59 gnl/MRDRNA2_/MRDRNA2_66940_c0_seq1:142-825(+)